MRKQYNIGSAIAASSLFHFTRKKRIFNKIISHGLRYSYSAELLPEYVIGYNVDFDYNIPMISFCDTPLQRISKHVNKYGSFGIGLNKTFILSKLRDSINPVNYLSSPELISSLCNIKSFVKSKQNEEIINIKNNPLQALINCSYLEISKILKGIDLIYAYFKPCQISHNNVLENFYIEREWRAVLSEDLEKGISWNDRAPRKTYKNIKNESMLVSKTSCSLMNDHIDANPLFHLQFTENEILDAIDSIIVPTNKDRDIIIKRIENIKQSLFGCLTVSKEIRHSLLSRIFTLEQIENDF